ncbi:DUF4190 domain-containing protein [Streptomyces sp. NPDC050264]|uniref:DUF4190 domain-containing protein n=1 Tax=Streptomyces sp. NPDC050264 TaxID=3155038 RepID=UPI00342B1685
MADGTTPQGSDPWAAPQDAAAQQPNGPQARGLHESQTVTAMPVQHAPKAPHAPQAPQPPQAPYPPQAPQAQVPPQAPYGAPPVQQGGPVPPPPVSPAGPGLPSYGAYQGGPGPGYAYPPQQPAPYGMPPQYGWPGGMPAQPSNGIGVTAMVTGIVSAVLCLMWPLAIILGILGIVFGIIGRGKAKRGEAANPGQALTGIICGSFGLVVGIGFIVLLVVVNS